MNNIGSRREFLITIKEQKGTSKYIFDKAGQVFRNFPDKSKYVFKIGLRSLNIKKL